MELALRLGQVSGVRALWATEKAASSKERKGTDLVLGMGFGFGRDAVVYNEDEGKEADEELELEAAAEVLQSNLLSLLPVPEQPSSRQLRFSRASENRNLDASTPGFDVNKAPSAEQGLTASSSPNTTFSTFPMEFSAPQGSAEWGEAAIVERESSRISDEEENGRKKLRLSKEQSTFLEESFKEHNTLNPKQKLDLAKQLNLRPRQVEVWFQNRRARTKLKQTEVDCEYLKRSCQTLSEENRRLQKEVAELRALKTSHPLYMHLPATTLSMCPSCERVASTTTTTMTAASTAATPASTTVNGDHLPNSLAILLSKAAPSASPPFPAIPRQPSRWSRKVLTGTTAYWWMM